MSSGRQYADGLKPFMHAGSVGGARKIGLVARCGMAKLPPGVANRNGMIRRLEHGEIVAGITCGNHPSLWHVEMPGKKFQGPVLPSIGSDEVEVASARIKGLHG